MIRYWRIGFEKTNLAIFRKNAFSWRAIRQKHGKKEIEIFDYVTKVLCFYFAHCVDYIRSNCVAKSVANSVIEEMESKTVTFFRNNTYYVCRCSVDSCGNLPTCLHCYNCHNIQRGSVTPGHVHNVHVLPDDCYERRTL